MVDQDVLRNRGEPLLATRDVRDLHHVVVDDVRHMIGRHAVGLEQDLHVDGIPWNLDRTIDAVDELAGALGRNLHAHDMRLAGIDARRHLFGGEMQAETVIFRRLAGGALALAHLLQPFRGAETLEAVAVGDDLVDIGTVEVLAVGLAIRAVGAADIGTFGPFETAPFQRVQHLLLELGRRARGVRILDAQDEGAVVLLGEEIVEQRDIGGADVGFAGRGGCDAYANAGCGSGSAHDMARLDLWEEEPGFVPFYTAEKAFRWAG